MTARVVDLGGMVVLCSTGTRLFTVKVVGFDDYTRKILESETGLSSQVGNSECVTPPPHRC
jgi:hypothetical protein